MAERQGLRIRHNDIETLLFAIGADKQTYIILHQMVTGGALQTVGMPPHLLDKICAWWTGETPEQVAERRRVWEANPDA